MEREKDARDTVSIERTYYLQKVGCHRHGSEEHCSVAFPEKKLTAIHVSMSRRGNGSTQRKRFYSSLVQEPDLAATVYKQMVSSNSMETKALALLNHHSVGGDSQELHLLELSAQLAGRSAG